MSRAQIAIERYRLLQTRKARTRFQPEADATRETDPTRPGVVFYRYPDGTSIRLDTSGSAHGADIQEF